MQKMELTYCSALQLIANRVNGSEINRIADLSVAAGGITFTNPHNTKQAIHMTGIGAGLRLAEIFQSKLRRNPDAKIFYVQQETSDGWDTYYLIGTEKAVLAKMKRIENDVPDDKEED